MNGQETISDIIAEMREIRVREFQDYADRLEAAWKRELGDCAKLRIALETLRELLEDLLRLEDAEYHNDFSNFCDIIDAALAAPPRNCDRFATLLDALAAWRDADPREAGPFDLWLFDTAKEGGAE